MLKTKLLGYQPHVNASECLFKFSSCRTCESVLITLRTACYVAGIIIFYELWLKSEDASRPRLVFNPSGQFDPLGLPTILPAPETSYRVSGLQPFTEYQLQVVAENLLGKTASDFATGRTAEAGSVLVNRSTNQPVNQNFTVVRAVTITTEKSINARENNETFVKSFCEDMRLSL